MELVQLSTTGAALHAQTDGTRGGSTGVLLVFASVLQTLAAFCGPGFLGPIQPAMAACKNR